MSRHWGRRGFTLIELVIAVSILAVLAGIGTLQFRESRARQELDRAAWELASDIRWMQQLSANDSTPRLANPPSYRFRVRLWESRSPGSPEELSNGYKVYGDPGCTMELKALKFSDYQVTAKILKSPGGGSAADITFYAYDLDRRGDGNQLENGSYKIELSHANSSARKYILVDARVGRVRIARDAAVEPL